MRRNIVNGKLPVVGSVGLFFAGQSSFVGSKVITSLHFSSALDSVLTSHADGRVRMWDMRQREGGVCKQSFGNDSKHWVSLLYTVLRVYRFRWSVDLDLHLGPSGSSSNDLIAAPTHLRYDVKYPFLANITIEFR